MMDAEGLKIAGLAAREKPVVMGIVWIPILILITAVPAGMLAEIEKFVIKEVVWIVDLIVGIKVMKEVTVVREVPTAALLQGLTIVFMVVK